MPDLGPQTDFFVEADLVQDLRRLGVGGARPLMVHSSLSNVGYVLGGAPSAVRAIVEATEPDGTIVMPAFSPEVSDPVAWAAPPPPGDALERARQHVPAFDPATTPTTMGTISETFRLWPGTVRGRHPQVSVAARGPAARRVVSPHPLAWAQGSGTPFERLCELDGLVLLLGVGFNRVTLLHYAESTLPNRREKLRRIPVGPPENRRWIEAPDVGDDLGVHFPALGKAFMARSGASVGTVGQARAVLAKATDLVSFAAAFLADALAEGERLQPGPTR